MKALRIIQGIVIAAIIGLSAQMPAFASRDSHQGQRSIDVMSVNLYIGGDPFAILALDPSDPAFQSNLVTAVTTVFYEIMSSQPALRLQGVADAIAERGPDIVAVQEASLIRIQSPGDIMIGDPAPATTVVADYLEILVAALAARGEHYAVASHVENMDVEMPMMNLQTGTLDDVRLTDRDAILVRTDGPPGQLNTKHPQSGNFTVALPIPDMGLSVPRGWCSVDVFVRGRRLRVICTHPEIQIAPPVQLAQISELLNGPADVDMPVILTGDFNSDPLHRDGSSGYDLFGAWNFKDAWTELNPSAPAGGLTWGHDQYLADPGTPFIWRLDLLQYRGPGIEPVDMDVIDMDLDRTEYPLWASDHAAIGARFILK